MKNDLAKELYKFYRSGFRKLRASGQVSIERTKNTDPQSLESVLSEVIAGRNWGKGFAEGNLFSNWAEIVGVEIAQHTTPISLVDGRLTIQSSSSAWATQMRLMQDDLLKMTKTLNLRHMQKRARFLQEPNGRHTELRRSHQVRKILWPNIWKTSI